LENLKKHIDKIYNYSNIKEDYKRLYYFSENMLKKGYLLNSITLLSEAVGMYAKDELKKINDDVKIFIEEFEQKIKNNEEPNYFFSLYTLSSSSKRVYKNPNKYDLFYFVSNNSKWDKWNKKSKQAAKYIKNYQYLRKDLQKLIKDVDNLRNNLAHGNSSVPIKEVKKEIENLLKKFKDISRIENV